ncbi:MAG: hypothetical protein CVU47_06115, partial [Chloroflexi bacterium HGW-Chloroflexi-9]
MTSAVAGITVHPFVQVSGSGPTPTGLAFVTWYANSSCALPAAAATADHALSAAGTVDFDGNTFTPPAPGAYSLNTYYSGDAHYAQTFGPCEPFTVDPLSPASVLTQVHDASHTVVTSAVAGTTVHPFVQLSGSGPTPTGLAFVTWYANSNCALPGIAATADHAPSATGTVDFDGNTFTPPAPGAYSLNTYYTGDAHYAQTFGPCEPFTVDPLSPASVLTQVHDAAHTVVTSAVAGITVHPFVQVSGSGPTPTGLAYVT